MAEKKKEFPRVLVVSHETFSANTSMGRTLTSYFNGWDRDCLAQIFIQSQVPTSSICGKFYKYTDVDALASLVQRGRIGKILTEKDVDVYREDATDTGRLRDIYYLGSKKKPVEPTVVYEPVIEYKHDTVVVEKVRVDTVFVQAAIDDINKILSDVVLFDFDKYDLTEEAIPVLNQVAAILKQHPKANIIVEGHTDNWGTDAYNQVLSEKRANTVVNYLKDQGVVCGLEPIGYGESRPVTDNSTEELRHQNRRIEFRLK